MTHKLLVIDDHPETLDIISRVLRQQGYAVIATSSGRQGLSLAESEHPDLILLDGMMPGMDGWEVCRHIRASASIAATPVIMFSAVNEAEQKLAGFDAGADDYLTKPTEPVELVERVKALLEGVPIRQDLSPEDFATPIYASTSDKSDKHDLTMTLSNDSHLVAVLGIRGGVGTTLLALNLAVSLAMQSRETILMDLDVQQGHVGMYLREKKADGLNSLLELPEGMLSSEIESSLLPYNEHLRLLLTMNSLIHETTTPTPGQVQEIVETLTQPHRFVVVDCGLGMTAVNRPVIEQADHIFVCVQPERVAMAVARKFLPKLQASLFPHTQMQAILLDFSGLANLPKQAIEGFLGHPLAALIPIKPQDLSRSVNKGTPLVEMFPDNEASTFITQLTKQLVKA